MFGIGMPELLLLLAVALIVFGPKKLPELAKSLGRALGEFKRATSDLKQSIESETGIDEVRSSLNEVKADIKTQVDLAGSVPDPSETPKASAAEPPADGPLDKVKSAFDEMNADTENATTDPPPADADPDTEEPDPK